MARRRIRVGLLVPMTLEGLGDEPLRELLELYEHHKAPDTELTVYRVERGSSTIECRYDEQVCGAFCLPEVERAERDGMDVIINTCFGDPALGASREAVRVPVVGTGQVSLFMAAMLGTKFSVIDSEASAAPLFRDQIRLCGLEGHLASVRHLGAGVTEILGGTTGARAALEPLKAALRREGLAAVERDGADVLVLACGGLGLGGVAKWLEGEVGVPVVDSNVLALLTAELLVKCGLSHSKRAYPAPEAKARRW